MIIDHNEADELCLGARNLFGRTEEGQSHRICEIVKSKLAKEKEET